MQKVSMYRYAMEQFLAWKNAPDRKPLVIRGARQVGKTWLMKEFGRLKYEQVAYVNFESSRHLQDIFKEDLDVRRIILALQIETGLTISADNTLIILDEIQEAPGALTSLKYFRENAPEYHIVSAGSLLGVALHQNTSFPVGKVDFMDLYPLNFMEFLKAMGQQPLADLLDSKDWKLITGFKTKYIQLLREYYYVGGMPEAVSHYSQNQDIVAVRNIQQQILSAYEQDFSKHAPNEIVPRIRMLWNSIPAQLAKENRKFIYGIIRQGARAKDYELALSWLIDCGLVHRVDRISKPVIPLKAYLDGNAFKLYLLDVGLLGALSELDAQTLLEGNRIFEEFKGALTEQYVLQQLLTIPDMPAYYWTSDTANAEVDFVVQYKGKVIPIEVKAEENLKAKSLRSFCQKYVPEMAVRTSMSDYRKEDWLTNIPLYAIWGIQEMDS